MSARRAGGGRRWTGAHGVRLAAARAFDSRLAAYEEREIQH